MFLSLAYVFVFSMAASKESRRSSSLCLASNAAVNISCIALKLSEVYRDALGRVSVAWSPARREPWRAPAVEDGIGARDRAPSLAGSSHAHDRCPRPARPDPRGGRPPLGA